MSGRRVDGMRLGTGQMPRLVSHGRKSSSRSRRVSVHEHTIGWPTVGASPSGKLTVDYLIRKVCHHASIAGSCFFFQSSSARGEEEVNIRRSRRLSTAKSVNHHACHGMRLLTFTD